MATDATSGRLPNNIIAKAPAAVRADRADRLGSLEGLAGRPCTKFGQTGTVTLRYRGLKDPTVTAVCKGIVGVDTAEPNNTVSDAVWMDSSSRSASLSPMGDVDWFRYVTSLCDPYSLQIDVYDGDADVTMYRGLDDSEQLSNPTSDLTSGEPVTIKVTGPAVTQYRLEVIVYCL